MSSRSGDVRGAAERSAVSQRSTAPATCCSPASGAAERAVCVPPTPRSPLKYSRLLSNQGRRRLTALGATPGVCCAEREQSSRNDTTSFLLPWLPNSPLGLPIEALALCLLS